MKKPTAKRANPKGLDMMLNRSRVSRKLAMIGGEVIFISLLAGSTPRRLLGQQPEPAPSQDDIDEARLKLFKSARRSPNFDGKIKEEFGLRDETDEALDRLGVISANDLLRNWSLRRLEKALMGRRSASGPPMIDEIRCTLAQEDCKLLGDKAELSDLVALL